MSRQRSVIFHPAFRALVAARLISGAVIPILDCDEVFNFWEPTHYLTHKFGLQTWEYSPEYAIRSWVYAGLNAGIVRFGQDLLMPLLKKFGGDDDAGEGVALFYLTRSVFGVVSAVVDTWLYLSIKEHIDPAVVTAVKDKETDKGTVSWMEHATAPSSLYMVFTLFATGLAHASVAYLPSSFAMFCTTIALAHLVRYAASSDIEVLQSTAAKGLAWIAVGGILGWPFALAIGGYWGLHVLLSWLFLGWSFQSHVSVFLPAVITKTLGYVLPVVGVIVGIDSWLYGKLAIVPLNIVLYNVLFADESSGPNIFGTEPWYYYLQNLALNFNIALPLFLAAPIAYGLWAFTARSVQAKQIKWHLLFAPAFVWLAIFSVQPHKEERFMYVAYPALLLNAALSTSFLLSAVSSAVTAIVPTLPRPVLKLAGGLAVVAAFVALSLSRSTALVLYYRAPVEIFTQISIFDETSSPYTRHAAQTVCVGREWYRFPSSYFLPDNMRLKFIASGFDGLLPGQFLENGDNPYSGIWEPPRGMNNKNQHDPRKLLPVDSCDFVVDSSYPVDAEAGELDFARLAREEEESSWKELHCAPLLDTGGSTGLARLLYVPESLQGLVNKVSPSTLKWTDFCLYWHNRTSKPDEI